MGTIQFGQLLRISTARKDSNLSLAAVFPVASNKGFLEVSIICFTKNSNLMV